MDGVLNDGRTGKLWMCKKHDGHALGIVVKDEHFVDRLLLFREAVTIDDQRKVISFPLVRIIGSPEGTMRDIECDICGSRRTWWIDRKKVAILLSPLYGKTGA